MKLRLLISAWLVTSPCKAMAESIYRSSGFRGVQFWNVSPNQNNSVFLFTVLFGFSVWFLARALWTQDGHKKWFNLGLFLIMFVPALWLIFPH